MIKFGNEVVRLSKSIKTNREIVKGYYLILNKTGEHIWFSKTVDAEAFEKACDKYLNESNDYDWSVEYCHGIDVHGRLAWENMDASEKFLEALDA